MMKFGGGANNYNNTNQVILPSLGTNPVVLTAQTLLKNSSENKKMLFSHFQQASIRRLY
jgi:hypothetical protein